MSNIGIGILLSVILMSIFIFSVAFLFWIINHIKKDAAAVNYLCAKEKSKAVTEELKDQKGLIAQVKIEEQISGMAYADYIRMGRIYLFTWIISLFITLGASGAGIYFIYRSPDNYSSNTQNQVSQNSVLFELPDGTYVSEDDVYMGADGGYYLKPEVAATLNKGE